MGKPKSETETADTAQPHPLDHDGDGTKGGVAPTPETVHLVVLKDSKSRGLLHGEVIATTDPEAKTLLQADVARNATAEEVELAQPRVRLWTA